MWVCELKGGKKMKLWQVTAVVIAVVLVGASLVFVLMFSGSPSEPEETLSGTVIECTTTTSSYEDKQIYNIVLNNDKGDDVYCIIIEPDFDCSELEGRTVTFIGRYIKCGLCSDGEGFLVEKYTVS